MLAELGFCRAVQKFGFFKEDYQRKEGGRGGGEAACFREWSCAPFISYLLSVDCVTSSPLAAGRRVGLVESAECNLFQKRA